MTCPNGHESPESASFCSVCGAAVPGFVAPPAYPAVPPPPFAIPEPPVGAPSANVVPYSSPYPATYPSTTPATLPVPMAAQMPGPAAPRTLYTIAAIINWVVLGLIIFGTLGIGIVCAAWFVPMTIRMHKGARDPFKHTALGVCTLLFCNIVSGILLLVDDSDKAVRR